MRIVARLIPILAFCNIVHAQTGVRGFVFVNKSTLSPARNAIVYLASGTNTKTSQLGHFNIAIPWPDSLHVYYEGTKWTIFITDAMLSNGQLNIYMNDTLQGRLLKEQLPPVFVQSKTYNQLVQEHQQEYSNAVNYHTSPVNMGNNKWHDSVASIGGKVALDTKNKKLSLLNVGSVAGALGSKSGRQKKRLQRKLIEDEHALYVRNIFTPALIKKYTTMRNEDSLHRFVTACAPSFDSLTQMTELDLGAYITRKMNSFRQH